MMRILVYAIVFFGTFSEALSKDIVDHDVRPEEETELLERDILLTANQRAVMDEATHEESRRQDEHAHLFEKEMMLTAEQRATDKAKRPEENYRLFQGDIMLTAKQRAIIDEVILEESMGLDGEHGQRKATSDPTRRWPNAEVPYVITSAPDEAVIMDAIYHWSDNTCIQLVPRTNEVDYVEFLTAPNDDVCSSYVGKIGGKQQIVLSSWCKMGNVAHEIGHAIGFWHEHMRPDRDDYISLEYDNIWWDQVHNFDKLTWSEIFTNGIDYDVGSLMHYARDAFSNNGEDTIIPHDPNDMEKMGQRNGLSDADVRLARAMYC